MAEVMNTTPVEALDPLPKDEEDKPSEDPESTLPPPQKKRDRDSSERKEEKDVDRPVNRRGGSNYNDRDRSPPQLPRDRDRDRERDRERDYKRRGSQSPPPPYRDRGYSPSRRSPPFIPFNKRSKRDDGGYGNRRGSPRGGFGYGDRRFGYDHGGGYERDTVGRPQFPNDRPHGRYNGRPGGYQSGPQDWDSGRGGYNDGFNTGSSQREGLMSYKQFIQELEDDILPAEGERRYQEYKSEYISTQKRAYFDANKDEQWLKDKYHPTNLVTVIERRNELARKIGKDFLLDLQSGSLDLGPGVSALTSNKPGQASDPNSDDDADTGGKRRRQGRSKASDLASVAPKAHPICSEQRRILIDIEQAQALIRKLDSEKGIEDNILVRTDGVDKLSREKSYSASVGPVIIIRGLTSVKGLEGIELLDTLLTYLWRIHGLDYYGMIETSEAKGLRHVRDGGKNFDAVGNNGAEWENKFDSHWQERLNGLDPLEIMCAKEKIDAAAVEGLDPYIRKIRDEKYGWKYGCGAKGCTKLFHAAEFVNKHLKLKHPELILDLTSKVREDLYFQNYMNDPEAPGGMPVMQQSLMKDRLQRQRPGMDTRLKDDRGNRRDRDNRASEKYDRDDKIDGPDGDHAMFDSFGGKGMAPYSSDIPPPPVLMPVPGAGPLGPFVPAPPEVAMRMFREQGGGGPQTREGGPLNGRLGPQLGGPGALINMPSAFRQDPRRLRSYQDLDAPEDEVTVIDYRSL